MIKPLIPGKTYVFRVQAETRIGFGPEVTWKQKMPILAPPKPPVQVVPTEVCRSSTTLQIRFRKNYFSEENGAVTSYTIIVAEDDSKNSSGLEMLSWRDVQGYSIWPPYQVDFILTNIKHHFNNHEMLIFYLNLRYFLSGYGAVLSIHKWIY